MKTCPNCNLYFNDGYACPNCGGALYDQDPYAQQAAYGQEYNPYAAGYDQYGYPQQPGFGYPPMQQPYGAPQAQPGMYQQPQAMPTPEPQYTEPMAAPDLQPPVMSSAASTTAATAAPTKHHPVRTAILIILALAATAVASICVYETLSNLQQEGPTELENAVINSAWTWQANVNDLLDEMDETMDAVRASTNTDNAGAAAADAAAPDDAAAAESTEPTSDVTEEGAAEAEAALEEAESITEGAEPTADTTAGEEQFQADGPFRQLLGYSIALQTLANESQLQAMDQPIQAMEETYPGLVVAWNGLRDIMASYNETVYGNADATAGASTSDATNTDGANAADATTNTDAATNTGTGTGADLTGWETFVAEFRSASSNFIQKANEAGFNLG